MVGIHALSIAKFVFRDKIKPKRRPLSPLTGAAAPQCSGPLPEKRSCAHQFAIVFAFGSVFERLGCPHKVADTRLALTTDR
jgi:hypothetical protein